MSGDTRTGAWICCGIWWGRDDVNAFLCMYAPGPWGDCLDVGGSQGGRCRSWVGYIGDCTAELREHPRTVGRGLGLGNGGATTRACERSSTMRLLRTLAVVVIAGGCSQHAAPAPEARGSTDEEALQKTLDDLTKLGATVKREEEEPSRPIIEVSLSEKDVTDSELAVLKNLTTLRKLDLSATKISGEGLRHLKGLASLQSL